MNITNRKNLPEIIVRAVQNDPYDGGDSDYSATTLIRPAYQVNLQSQHKGELVDDVADRLWAMYGSAVHYIIERAADEADLVEERFFAQVNGKKISAQIDHYRDHVITDAKLTGAYKVKKALAGEGLEDWEAQLNIQAYLMTENGYEIEKLCILAMVRDWSKSKANPESYLYEEGYPDQIEVIDIPLWSRDKQLEYIESRIHALAHPEPCTRAERWQDDPKYALVKKGASRALKVESSQAELFNWALQKGHARIEMDADGIPLRIYNSNVEVETREAPPRRCLDYCSVNKFCEWYKSQYASAEEIPFK